MSTWTLLKGLVKKIPDKKYFYGTFKRWNNC